MGRRKFRNIRLGVNIDHVATLREARGTSYPDPVAGALLAEYAGCDSIVMHLREDRRHIKERDALLVRKAIKIPLNLEMSTNKDIVVFAKNLSPDQATLVPEKRQELTTEGGLDLSANYKKTARVVNSLKQDGIKVSLFIDPVKRQIKAAKDLGADIIEINTGKFSEAKNSAQLKKETQKIKVAVDFAKKLDFPVAAGHGLDYDNVKTIAAINGIEELNIGHAIISFGLFVGITAAVEEMFNSIAKKR